MANDLVLVAALDPTLGSTGMNEPRGPRFDAHILPTVVGLRVERWMFDQLRALIEIWCPSPGEQRPDRGGQQSRQTGQACRVRLSSIPQRPSPVAPLRRHARLVAASGHPPSLTPGRFGPSGTSSNHEPVGQSALGHRHPRTLHDRCSDRPNAGKPSRSMWRVLVGLAGVPHVGHGELSVRVSISTHTPASSSSTLST